MALVLNEEQQMLKDSAAGFLAEKAPVSALRALRDSEDATGYSADLWREMAEMGWPGIAVPEEFGGIDYGYVGLGLILEQAGRTLTASPLQSTVLVAATAISHMGSQAQKEQWLPAIAAGEKVVSLALQEGAHHAPEQTAATAAANDQGFVLNGEKVLVLDGHVADCLIVVARTAGEPGDEHGISLFLVDSNASGVSVARRSMVDSRNAAAVSLKDVQVGADALLGDLNEGSGGLSYTLDIANLGLAAELLGLSQEAFERTMEYLKERKQFGVVIGSFQGLKHRAAEMFAELELCRSLVLKALQSADTGDENLPALASAAKAKLSQVAQRVTNEAVQMHGGIGMTDEFDIGFFIKRARVAQHTFGDYNYHLDRYARLSGF